MRRLFASVPTEHIHAGSKLDPTEIDETAALIDLSPFTAPMPANPINEVTLRTFPDLQHYVEAATATVRSTCGPAISRLRPFRQMQMEAAVPSATCCLGHDYASLMKKAADVAISGERRVPRKLIESAVFSGLSVGEVNCTAVPVMV